MLAPIMADRRPPKTRAYDAVFRFRNEHPGLQPVLQRLNRFTRIRPPVRFRGWGLTTTHEPPWHAGERDAGFRESLELVHQLQFTGEAGISATDVQQLAWRHWVITFAARYAATMSKRPDGAPLVGAELGVADGTTAWFALRELTLLLGADQVQFHLFDAWNAIRAESLLPGEAVQGGRYAGLSIDLTKANLAAFAPQVHWHVGYVPQTLDEPDALPNLLSYVHIDLNAATPTIEACERLWPHLTPGGVMIFDDYGWVGFEDTKRAVDEFVADKPGVLLLMPTAQALFLRA
jgi:hypothetical protein